MNNQQIERMLRGKGFIAALDQSGGSTPKALAGYGVQEHAYSNEKEDIKMMTDDDRVNVYDKIGATHKIQSSVC